MNIIQLGTSYYLITDEGLAGPLTYEQYLVLCDLANGRIEPDQIEEKLKFYQHQHENVPCPICDKGLISRNIAEDDLMLNELHSILLHLPACNPQ